MKFLRVSRWKNGNFFLCRAFLSCSVGECLSKCPNSKKTSLPWKIPVYAPADLTWQTSNHAIQVLVMKRSYEKSQFIESVRQSHIYLHFNMLLQRKSLYDGLPLTLNEMILVVKWESEKSMKICNSTRAT